MVTKAGNRDRVYGISIHITTILSRCIHINIHTITAAAVISSIAIVIVVFFIVPLASIEEVEEVFTSPHPSIIITITTIVGVGVDQEAVVWVEVDEMDRHPHLRIIPMEHGYRLHHITNIINITIMAIIMG